jgi:hypothetical protein
MQPLFAVEGVYTGVMVTGKTVAQGLAKLRFSVQSLSANSIC